ncbi:hypothetical protein I545_6792 [Mycobacterium kansasii 662]|uniref:Uncharacterized protein n=1 Tax=Mycobacterium kansasii 662 TaxID=1299326 RepID=X7XT04_MYCKA|nr:hypothetical protein I545_6792 [Mycobacterium kansasii 662]
MVLVTASTVYLAQPLASAHTSLMYGWLPITVQLATATVLVLAIGSALSPLAPVTGRGGRRRCHGLRDRLVSRRTRRDPTRAARSIWTSTGRARPRTGTGPETAQRRLVGSWRVRRDTNRSRRPWHLRRPTAAGNRRQRRKRRPDRQHQYRRGSPAGP